MAPNNTQFSIAVHILTGIAKVGNASSSELSSSVQASPIFLKRILAKLSKAGLISTTQGRTGGSTLARAANKISLHDVFVAVEIPTAFAVHGYPMNKSCEISCNIQGAMHGVLGNVQSAIEKELKSRSIADVLKEMKRSK